jgi:hypothetical protein
MFVKIITLHIQDGMWAYVNQIDFHDEVKKRFGSTTKMSKFGGTVLSSELMHHNIPI